MICATSTICAWCSFKIPKEGGWITEPSPGVFEAVCAACMVRMPAKSPPAADPRLKDHQIDGVLFLAERRVALLADQQGLGKTVQALCALPQDAPVVVVSPVSMVAEWYDEAAIWRPDLLSRRLTGKRDFVWPKAGGFVSISYESLPDEEPPPGTVLVLDEVHLKIKNPGTSLTQKIRRVARSAVTRGGRCWLLSATPMINRPDDLWEVLETVLLGSAAFATWADYSDLFEDYYTSSKHARKYPEGEKRAEIMRLLSSVVLRRLKRDLPEKDALPPKRVEVIEVEITPEHTQQIHQLVCRLVAAKRTDEAVKAGLIEDPRDRKVTKEVREARKERWKSHMEGVLLTLKDPDEKEIKESVERALLYRDETPAWTELAAVRAALATAKIAAMVELVERFEADDEPVVVFSSHRAPIEVLSTRPRWAMITGSETPGKRKEAKDAFQRGELRGVGVTIRAGGTGLTLTRGCNAVFVDRDYTSVANDQASDRVHRFTQTRAVTIWLLVARHAVDLRVEEILEEKSRLIDSIFGEQIVAEAAA